MKWRAKFYQKLPQIRSEYPNGRWLFLTLTVRNCEIEDLGATLKDMNEAWKRLTKRKEFAPVLGWVRTTEVTRGKGGSAHPHFHCMLLVPSSWFQGKLYVSHARWVEIWRDCGRFDYDPNVDIRTVKSKRKGADEEELLSSAIQETLKYAVKPSDMLEDHGWFLEMTRQVHRKRFIATGGVLKGFVNQIEEEIEEEMKIGFLDTVQEELDKEITLYGWRLWTGKYKYIGSRKNNKTN